jgi:uncharacterized protein (DUF362 family)/ferredoxin
LKKTLVAVVRCDSYDGDVVYEALRRGIDLLGGLSAFAAPGERILVKPNALAAEKPERAVTTHPAVFGAVLRLFAEGGAALSYGDSPGFGKPAEAMERCGLAREAVRYGACLGDFERGRAVDYPEGAVGKRFDIAQACLDADGIVSVSKMKTHQLTRITGAVKNQFGCVHGLNKAAFHVKVPNPVNFSKLVVDLNRLLAPRLFVMDGVVAMEGNGPRSGSPVAMNCLIVSADPVAVDATFCRLVDLDPDFVPAIVFGAAAGLGRYREEEIEYVGDGPAGFRNPDFDVVRRPVHDPAGKRRVPPFIADAVYPRPEIDSAACVRCGICVSACPVGERALSFPGGDRKRPPEYDYRNCIRCYCCQELCPHRAIAVRTPFLGRLIAGK